jgi:hypothetical protein
MWEEIPPCYRPIELVRMSRLYGTRNVEVPAEWSDEEDDDDA